MIEMFIAGLAFVAAQVLFHRTNLGKSLSIWKSVGLSIFIIGFSVVLFIVVGGSFYSIIFVPTIVCSVMVSTRYREYLIEMRERFHQMKLKKEEV